MISIKPFNTETDGASRIIKSQYYKMGAANVLDNSTGGANYKATGVLIVYD